MSPEKSVTACVATLRAELAQIGQAMGNGQRPIRRKVRRLLAESGRKIVTESFVADMAQALAAAKIFTNRSLIGRPLFQDEWLEFNTEPFSPHAVCFAFEHDLVEFMRRAVGVVPPLDNLREIGEEFSLASRKRIDLCEEVVQSGKGALVAIEFKRSDAGYGVVAQLDVYLDELSKHPKSTGREVRGLIISGPDAEARSAPDAPSRNHIEWYCYQIGLTKLARAGRA